MVKIPKKFKKNQRIQPIRTGVSQQATICVEEISHQKIWKQKRLASTSLHLVTQQKQRRITRLESSAPHYLRVVFTRGTITMWQYTWQNLQEPHGFCAPRWVFYIKQQWSWGILHVSLLGGESSNKVHQVQKEVGAFWFGVVQKLHFGDKCPSILCGITQSIMCSRWLWCWLNLIWHLGYIKVRQPSVSRAVGLLTKLIIFVSKKDWSFVGAVCAPILWIFLGVCREGTKSIIFCWELWIACSRGWANCACQVDFSILFRT